MDYEIYPEKTIAVRERLQQVADGHRDLAWESWNTTEFPRFDDEDSMR